MGLGLESVLSSIVDVVRIRVGRLGAGIQVGER